MTLGSAYGAGAAALQFMSRGRTATDGTSALATVPGVVQDLPTQYASSGTAITWGAVNKEFEINQAGFYQITYHARDQSVGTHSAYAYLYLDTGSGPAVVDSAFGGFVAGAYRHSIEVTIILELNAGDALQLWMAADNGTSTSAADGTLMNVMKVG